MIKELRRLPFGHFAPFRFFRLLPLIAAVAIGACGGGGGGGNKSPSDSNWTAGVFQSSKNFAGRCENPRAGNANDQKGSTTSENNWLRSWTHELYLWYGEVPDINPGSYNSALDYFDTQKTSAVTASGKAKDQFHFTYPTAEWEALSQSGVQAGYGVTWVFGANRDIRVGLVEPGSPAAVAGLARGAKILYIDGINVLTANDGASIDALNAAFAPDNIGQSHTFTVEDFGSNTQRAVSLTSASITGTPVQSVQTINTGSGTVGYLLFNDHVATAEQQLIAAITTLKNANISDLVLDIRYNGGGYLYIASQLAYMIAGPTPTAGKIFETSYFNNQYAAGVDPVTGNPPMSFLAVTQRAPFGEALPTLNLPRVYVLTGVDTCSASESIINGLRGVDVEVIQIGSTTCGKPYGFYPADNCGTTYFSIQFKGANQKGFGDYADGFSPANTIGAAGVSLPGCSVADDFAHAVGDSAEGRLAAALSYRQNQSCPAASGFAQQLLLQQTARRQPAPELTELRKPTSPLHNRIMQAHPGGD